MGSILGHMPLSDKRELETAQKCIDRALEAGHDSRAFREMRAMIRKEWE